MAKMQMIVCQVEGAGEDLLVAIRQALAQLELSGAAVTSTACETDAQKKTAEPSTAGSRRRGSGRETLWQWLQAQPEAPRWADIVRGSGVPTGSIPMFLKSLIAECRVVKTPEGRYEVLTDSAAATTTSAAS